MENSACVQAWQPEFDPRSYKAASCPLTSTHLWHSHACALVHVHVHTHTFSKSELSVATHICNLGAQEANRGESCQFQGHPLLCTES